MQPVVSICIPAYKQPELLVKNLISVLAQTYVNYEVIITDDSRDNAVEQLVKKYTEKFSERLKYFKNEKTLGSPQNWNEAIGKAKGKYIKILHHDDWFSSPDSLSAFVKMLDDNPEAGFAFCATAIIEADSGTERKNSPSVAQLAELKSNPKILFFGNFIGPPSSVIYRNNCGIVFDKKVKYVVDVDFYICMLQKNNSFVFNPDTLIVNTSKNPNQVTSQSLDAVTQLGEYAYLFNKINSSLIPSKKYVSFFKSLFLKYDVKSMDWFVQNNIEAPKPAIVFSKLISYLKLKNLYKS